MNAADSNIATLIQYTFNVALAYSNQLLLRIAGHVLLLLTSYKSSKFP